MAAPIQLKANTPGGNSHKKSLSRQGSKDGHSAKMASKPKVRTDAGKKVGGAGVKPAYNASASVTRPKVKGVNKSKTDSTSSWMTSHGLRNTQNAGAKTRLHFANVPADGIGAGTSTRKSAKSSSATTKARVKTNYTGKSFQTTRRARVIRSK